MKTLKVLEAALQVSNPFGAPIYHEKTVTSTMDVSKTLASKGAAHGTVITADFQEAGRGRGLERKWEMERDKSLPFTILLRYKYIDDIPKAITLRVGLAVSLAVEWAALSLKDKVKLKWPNDIIINNKKICGILCESDGGNVHAGIGINVKQKEFAPNLQNKATSIILEAENEDKEICAADNFCLFLLEKILICLYAELETSQDNNWKRRIEQRLYKKDEQVIFKEGAADDSGKTIKGRLYGISDSGELLIIPNGESEAVSCVTGELVFV